MGPLTESRAFGAVATVCATIALLDLLQVGLIGKGMGAIGGCVLYTCLALGLLWHRREAAWVVLAMPLVPLSVMAGLLGSELRDQLVDRPMMAVALLQIVASLGAGGLLFAARFRRTR